MKTYGELLTALIAHYEWCVKNLPEDSMFWRNYFLQKHHIHYGICNCADYIFSVRICNTLFLSNLTNKKTYLCHIPYSRPYEYSKQCLQNRIDRMKEVYDEWKDVEIGV